ncbi:unnamed protein product [Paramecium sonneborni]|uniref:WD40-repeat-containing domain n=1 Tax=Paramecium sonneborni TaxID=65129 RepID=A0A8S1P3U8_9CILI|nr:unnamed protein product [Paramecium sonneborni]
MIQKVQLIKYIQEVFDNLTVGQLNCKKEAFSQFQAQLFSKDSSKQMKLECKTHIGQQIVKIDINEKKSASNRLVCVQCISNYPGQYVTLQEFEEEYYNYVVQKQDYKSQLLEIKQIEAEELNEMFSGILLQITNSINTIQAKINNVLSSNSQSDQEMLQFDQIMHSYEKLEEIAQKISNQKNLNFNQNDLINGFSNWNAINKQLEQEFEEVFKRSQKQLKIFLTPDKNNDQFKRRNRISRVEKFSIPVINQKINKTQLNASNFCLMVQYSVQQNEYCYAIAINKDCSTLVAGCNSQIKVFEFKQGMLKQIQILNEHNSYVYTLNFMKKQNQFISGSYKLIIIWQNNQNSQWISQFRLIGHNDYILCLILNNNDDTIISGSCDKTIKFWMKKNEWLCQQTITDHFSYVFGLSLNQLQNRVISCGADNMILIMEQSQQNKEWIVIQKITFEQYGFRICFIDNYMFTFQPLGKDQMSIFEMNSINKQFSKIKDISVKCGSDSNSLFPQQYINQKSMLMSKSGEYVNFIRKKQNGEFVTDQSIHFETPLLFGVMSEDGEYLITWDSKSKQIQIRKYYEEE